VPRDLVTIGIAWIRRTGEGEELWFASDSRLGGDGYIWDDCPKLVILPRRDAVAAFSGTTRQAYPLLLQIANAVRAYPPARTGSLEFFDVLGHLERVINSMLDRLVVDPGVHGAPEARRAFGTSGDAIVLGGFSRAVGGFVLRALEYDSANENWRFARVRGSPVKIGSNKVFRIFGDAPSRRRYRDMLESRLQAAGKLRSSAYFDFEPIETLWAFLEMPSSSDQPLPPGRRPMTTGGSVQVIRVLAGADAAPFAVRWEAPPTRDYLLGRRCFPYEHIDAPLIARSNDPGRMLQITAPNDWSILDMAE
jgi:hypothetical protein